MPFVMPSFDVHLANIVRGYLSSAAAITAGLPSVESLPRVAVYNNTAKTFPLLVVAGAAQAQSKRHQRITVVAALHSKLPAQDAENPREANAATMKVVHDLLHEQSLLYAFIAALPEEERTGFQIRRVYPGIVGQPVLLKDESAEMVPCSIDFDIRLPTPD